MSTQELAWFKSSYSGGEGGECAEISPCPHTIHIRDSKNPTGPHLALSPTTWSAFPAGELAEVLLVEAEEEEPDQAHGQRGGPEVARAAVAWPIDLKVHTADQPDITAARSMQAV